MKVWDALLNRRVFGALKGSCRILEAFFFIFHSDFLLTDHWNLQQDHCSSICNALMIVTGVTETSAKCCLYRFPGRYFYHKAIQHLHQN